MVIFGYKGNGIEIKLHDDGTLLYMAGDQTAALSVHEQSMLQIRRLLDDNHEMLKECASRINGNSGTEGENCFIFKDCRIIDWDLTRWYLEEDRSRHPEYYNNTVKVELVENLVRSVFDEICDVISEEGSRLLYGRTVIRGI